MKTTFMKVYATENGIHVIGFLQDNIAHSLYGYRVMIIALCCAWLYILYDYDVTTEKYMFWTAQLTVLWIQDADSAGSIPSFAC